MSTADSCKGLGACMDIYISALEQMKTEFSQYTPIVQ